MFDFLLGMLWYEYVGLCGAFIALWLSIRYINYVMAVGLTVVLTGLFIDKINFNFNIITILLIAIAYLSTGVVWSFFKWIKYVKECKSERFDGRKFSAEREAEVLKDLKYDLKFSRHIERIVTWVSFWPISIIDYALTDFICNMFNKFTNLFKSVYDKITQKILGI